MEIKQNNDQSQSQVPDVPEAGEAKPVSKTWQENATKMLNFLKDWFVKLKPAYKIIIILFIAVLLVLILLAYLGVFGQGVSDLIKQLVNRILEMVKEKKS